MNSQEFKNLKLHTDSTLKSLKKDEYRELSLLLEKIDEEVCERLCILNCPFCCENFCGEKCALEVVQSYAKKKLDSYAK